uniref:NADH-ubiquinone oxidoreductase chain 5 n=1 Tax=Alloeorhynchus bakeri TaxID=796621 RepID=G9B4J0_9HEMI|nr:NADH dehydrogenase subunit 5 [Alloeorhynchus bakeri]ADI75226.1 NADH dehydrogenase subunit 5 [Alloeorhynchus bakeri]
MMSIIYMLWGYILLIMSLLLFMLGLYFINMNYLVMLDWEVLSLNSCTLVMTILFDFKSLMFMSSVMMISSMVIFYSSIYMEGDKNRVRFLYLVLMFIMSMMMMIMSPNLVSILLGWDGLGLVSYGLVIYFQNYKSYAAGMLTILMNRVGDAAILICVGWMINFGSWHYMYYSFIWDEWVMYICLLLILAAFTKSAQIPFSSWLPAAMAAPTPVSALVHSSTLVTAGVYLLIRFSGAFVNMDCSLFVLFGMMTMFMSGLGASFEFDLKSIIALSTLSQLGLMMSVLFMGYIDLSFFHLLTHAFFKALLFLCAGIIIHVMNDSQDIRSMGGIVNYMPYTSLCFMISNMSLCGLPFLSGFYSKDFMLEMMVFDYYNLTVFLIFYISVGLTSCYTIRVLYYCILGNNNMYVCQLYKENYVMICSMMMLVVMSIMGGSILSWLIFSFPELLVMTLTLKLMALFFIMFGVFLGYELSLVNYTFNLYSFSLMFFSSFSGSMWFLPSFSTFMVYSVGLNLGSKFNHMMDIGWGESLMSSLLYNYSINFGLLLNKYLNNNMKIYLVSFLMLFIFFLV